MNVKNREYIEFVFNAPIVWNPFLMSGVISFADVYQLSQRKYETIILITHDQKVANHCKRILTIEDGKLHE